MDEAPVLRKHALHAMDEILQKNGNATSPFDGKTMVLGGDFRQCLKFNFERVNKNLLTYQLKRVCFDVNFGIIHSMRTYRLI